MISSGINPNVGIEEQEYCITKLGYILDKYAISLHDEERMKWHNKHEILEDRQYDIPFVEQKGDNEIYKLVKQKKLSEKEPKILQKGKCLPGYYGRCFPTW